MPSWRAASVATLAVAVVLGGCSSGPSGDAASSVSVPADGITPPGLAAYNAQSLVSGASFGKAGKAGGAPYTVTEDGNVVEIPSNSGSIAMTIYSGGSLSNIQLRYQLNVTTPLKPTRVSIIPGQGVVIDGRLVVLQSVQPYQGSTLVQASLLVFPASRASGLPRT